MGRPTSVATFRVERRAAFRLPYVVGVVAVAVALAVGLVFLIDRLARSLIQIDNLEPADAIVAENWAYPNMPVLERAAELQQQGYGRHVLVPYQTPAEAPGATGGKRGLRIDLACEAARLDPFTTERIPLKQAGMNTLGEARVVSAVLHRLRVRRVILVTTLFHSRRSALSYSKFLGRNVKVVSAPVSGSLTPENWWRTSAGRREVISNFLKLQYYRAVAL